MNGRGRQKPELRFGGDLFVFEGRQSKARKATPEEIWAVAMTLTPPKGTKRGKRERQERK